MLNIRERMAQKIFEEIQKVNEKYIGVENTPEQNMLLQMELTNLLNNKFDEGVLLCKIKPIVTNFKYETFVNFIDSQGKEVYILSKYMVPKYKRPKTYLIMNHLQDIIDIIRKDWGVNKEGGVRISHQLHQYIQNLFDEGVIKCVFKPHVAVLESDYVVRFKDIDDNWVDDIEDYYL